MCFNFDKIVINGIMAEVHTPQVSTFLILALADQFMALTKFRKKILPNNGHSDLVCWPQLIIDLKPSMLHLG